MGDIKKFKKKYSGPVHPWNKERIESERPLVEEYGLKNKKELWRFESKRKIFADIAKNLIAAIGKQAEKEREQMFSRLQRLGLLKSATKKLDDVLDLETRDLLERRLQTLVFRKGLASSIKQARQLITHRHVNVGGERVTSPSYLVPIADESTISFASTSAINNPAHPLRQPQKPGIKSVSAVVGENNSGVSKNSDDKKIISAEKQLSKKSEKNKHKSESEESGKK